MCVCVCVCVYVCMCVCVCHLCRCMMGNKLQTWSGSQPRGLGWDCHATSALRSSSRVQNTNTNCPHNTGLLSDRKGRSKKRRPGGSYISSGVRVVAAARREGT